MNQVNSNDLSQYKECMKLVNIALNKACKAGVYSLDEAYFIKIATANLEKIVETHGSDTKPKDQS